MQSLLDFGTNAVWILTPFQQCYLDDVVRVPYLTKKTALKLPELEEKGTFVAWLLVVDFSQNQSSPKCPSGKKIRS